MSMFIPDTIKKIIADKSFDKNNIGLSAATVLIFDDMVLKIEKHTEITDETVKTIRWLKGKLPVPEIICYEIYNETSYLLMSKIAGKMACDSLHMEQADEMVTIIAKGLKQFWNVDISGCPREFGFEKDIREARYNVENGLIDETALDNILLDSLGIKSVNQLLEWVENNVPAYEPVLSHGDYCLPNVLIKDNQVSGFIDLGECGISDKWKDIALCYISLKNNFSGFFGGKVYPNFNPDILIEKLKITPNRDKLNYWFLLNELFKVKRY